MKKLAELSISPTHVANLPHEIGRGLIETRDRQAERERFRQHSPGPDPRERSPETAHEALTYLQNNRTRMNYPDYRRQGMPVPSSLIESLIKEFNWRVKGTLSFPISIRF